MKIAVAICAMMALLLSSANANADDNVNRLSVISDSFPPGIQAVPVIVGGSGLRDVKLDAGVLSFVPVKMQGTLSMTVAAQGGAVAFAAKFDVPFYLTESSDIAEGDDIVPPDLGAPLVSDEVNNRTIDALMKDGSSLPRQISLLMLINQRARIAWNARFHTINETHRTVNVLDLRIARLLVATSVTLGQKVGMQLDDSTLAAAGALRQASGPGGIVATNTSFSHTDDLLSAMDTIRSYQISRIADAVDLLIRQGNYDKACPITEEIYQAIQIGDNPKEFQIRNLDNMIFCSAQGKGLDSTALKPVLGLANTILNGAENSDRKIFVNLAKKVQLVEMKPRQ